MQKKIAIILGVIVLALALGFVGSQWMGSPHGPEETAETPEERAARLGLGADVNADETGSTTDLAPVEARPLTGNEGQVIDGVRDLADVVAAREAGCAGAGAGVGAATGTIAGAGAGAGGAG